jgi:5'(3')-deoxyribonucleotidase
VSEGEVMEKVFLLDLDGVIADFYSSMCRAFGHDPAKAMTRLKPEDWWFRSVLGEMTESHFWGVIDKLGEAFWADMEMYPHAHELYEELESMAPVYFVSQPSNAPFSASGKVRWLQKFFRHPKCRAFFLTPHKSLLAKPNHLLIDDSDVNCKKFVEAGGNALLFPRRWNSAYADFDAGVSVSHTLQQARDWFEHDTQLPRIAVL